MSCRFCEGWTIAREVEKLRLRAAIFSLSPPHVCCRHRHGRRIYFPWTGPKRSHSSLFSFLFIFVASSWLFLRCVFFSRREGGVACLYPTPSIFLHLLHSVFSLRGMMNNFWSGLVSGLKFFTTSENDSCVRQTASLFFPRLRFFFPYPFVLFSFHPLTSFVHYLLLLICNR